MAFDKSNAMRNAERYVSQGKISAAISEYRSVVDNDPRDVATLNMLGDLYAKRSEKKEAVACYMQVADHYNKQGFSQKAIAVYNKISRIQPDSIDVSAKLAELHKVKGSLSEARTHYSVLAEHYQKNGHRLEALAMYKQIALLDPNNTAVCINLADSYMRENQHEEAVEAFAEAGARFSRQNRHEEAIRALMKGYDIRATDLRILNGLVKAQTALGRAAKAISLLDEILENDPYNRDVLYLLIDSCLESQNAAGAERAVIKLVEIEPANYSKFVDLIRIYLNVNDHESAARILTMSSEYLLAGGQSEECGKWINEILEREPEQISGLRLLVRYTLWLNDKNGARLALERLYIAAATKGAIEDEHFALKQLVVIIPHETRFRDRLAEINAEYNFEDDDEPVQETVPSGSISDAANVGDWNENTIEVTGHDENTEDQATEFERHGEIVDAAIVVSSITDAIEHTNGHSNTEVNKRSLADDQHVQSEFESISFYIDNDYKDLAEKAITTLAEKYGDIPEVIDLRHRLNGTSPVQPSPATEPAEHIEKAGEIVANTIGINEIRSEFGLSPDDSNADDSDYDTHFHMAVAYQEMGLLEESIREYQDAINLTRPDDGSRKFFSCANLLGHCFMQNGMPNHAITWFERALETPEISDEEHHGLWYELALAYEANNEPENASRYFEQIYSADVDFRDVGERVKIVVNTH